MPHYNPAVLTEYIYLYLRDSGRGTLSYLVTVVLYGGAPSVVLIWLCMSAQWSPFFIYTSKVKATLFPVNCSIHLHFNEEGLCKRTVDWENSK